MKPRIVQWLDKHALPNTFYGKWFIIKHFGVGSESHRYLHRDGIWRESTYNPLTDNFDGYYDDVNEAERCLELYESD